ncbi:MAG: tyrosine-type recombinase/integrase [Oligoflexia bacterium]|nr:tyrosine-type recombinase/integrase [Oligoflexia bacterium]
MARFRSQLPVSSERRSSGERTAHEVWLRITAFLSLKAPGTQITYRGIIEEWCRFLGAEAGSAEAAQRIASANDLKAMAFRVWLEKQPGEAPRAQRKESARARGVQVYRQRAGGTKKTGLEHTQSNATIAKKFAALRRIYRMLMASGVGVRENPFDSDRVPAPPKDAGRKRPTEMLDFAKVMELVKSADESTPKGLRDKAILSVLFGGALRRSEVVGLRVGDVRRTPAGTAFLYLRSTKAKKDAQQALPKWAARVVELLIKQRIKDGAGGADHLFVSYTGKGGSVATPEPISDSGVYKLFKRYCALAGVGEFLTPHSARATAITKLLADGIPHREVQEFSRHSSIQMVELYDKRRIGVDQSPAAGLEYD